MKKKLDYKAYPAPDATRSGAKVGWYYYRDRNAVAKAAATVAKHNARSQTKGWLRLRLSAPPARSRRWSGREHAGMWEVCIP